jgi:hypothetical protein
MMIEKAIAEIRDALASDIVSCGEMLTIAADVAGSGFGIADILPEVLALPAEVGFATDVGNYVKLTAWRGSIQDRLDRALREHARSNDDDKAFCFWLCLPQNVDEYEEPTTASTATNEPAAGGSI